MRHPQIPLLLTLLVLLVRTSDAFAQRKLTPIALTGDPAPGLPTARFDAFERPVINSEGNVAFLATITGPGITSDDEKTLYLSRDSSLRLLVQGASSNASHPGLLSLSGSPSIGTSSWVLFEALSDGNRPGVWTASFEQPRPLVQRGDVAPGISNAFFYAFPTPPAINASDQILLHAELRDESGGSQRDSLWIGSPAGDFRLLAITGQHAVGLPEVDRYGAFLYAPTINATANVALLATIGSQSPEEIRRGIWTGASSPLQTVAFSGAALPGANAPLRTVNPPVINASGDVLFHAIAENNSDGVWLYSGGQITPVALEGQPAPTSSRSIFFGFDYPIHLNDREQLAFEATVEDAEHGLRNVLVAGTPGSLRIVASGGDAAPGADGGLTDSTFAQNPFQRVFFNNAGNILTLAELTGPGVNAGNDRGLWTGSTDGDLRLILREGQLLDFGDGDLRTLEWFDLLDDPTGIPGGRSAFNDAGQFAFLASFTDGSQGIFIATIPQPSTAALISLTLTAASSRRRRTSRNPKI